MKIEIKNLDGEVIYSHECEGNTVWKTVEAAVREGADLSRADLSRADLYGANLSGANLSGAVVLGDTIEKAPVSVANLRWSVLITEHKMQIGCQTHTHEEWASFDDRQIAEMDGKDALRFWRQWKTPLLAMCAAHKEQK